MTTPRERGRPTQFHGVPLEERAFDSQGNRLPWALEWADEHPNARLLKRQPDEKGSFGKSTRRRGSSRPSRTQTPAKKENPTLDGFEAAWKFDQQNDLQLKQANTLAAGDAGHQNALAVAKEPLQVILYGYSSDTQWAALAFYESVSGGMICEDYDREPPMERRRLYTGMEHMSGVARRPLTSEERTLAMRYSGGRCWIKVTFDSKDAAERALASSPHPIQGHWVHAQQFKGHGPEADEPIPVRDEDREQGLLGTARPSTRAATLGPAAGHGSAAASVNRGAVTLPRSFVARSPELDESNIDAQSVTSTTASSATATITEPTGLRHREVAREAEVQLNNSARFPDIARTELRPASEALLPQSSWSERILRSLMQGGWIPGDVIGTVVPRLENGEFDWASASFYWKVFYWVDSHFGTDLCGMKDS